MTTTDEKPIDAPPKADEGLYPPIRPYVLSAREYFELHKRDRDNRPPYSIMGNRD